MEDACDAKGRGGLTRIRSQGCTDPLMFDIYYRETNRSRPVTYEIEIDQDDMGRPYVSRERLRQRRRGQSTGWPFSFLLLDEGKGVVWKGDAQAGNEEREGDVRQFLFNLMASIIEKRESDEESTETEVIELTDKRHLGISTLGALM